MKCVICKEAEVKASRITITLEREGLTVAFRNAPARVCPGCGEEYVDEKVGARLLERAEELAKDGAQMVVREYEG